MKHNATNHLLELLEEKNHSFFSWMQEFSNYSKEKFQIQEAKVNKDDTHPIFLCTLVASNRDKISSGRGRTKKEAKQNAARQGLANLLNDNKKALHYFT
jgi:dsRNA-specific ribonuclease